MEVKIHWTPFQTNTDMTKMRVNTRVETINQFFRSLLKILSSPRNFFREDFQRFSNVEAIVFGVVCHWIGAALGHLGAQFFSSQSFSIDQLAKMFSQNQGAIDSIGRQSWFQDVSHLFNSWVSGVSNVILDPFYVLGATALSSILIFVAARLFIGPNRLTAYAPVRYSQVFKILILACAPSLFAGVPLLGWLVASCWTFVLAIVGVQEALGAGAGVATIVVLANQLLIFGVVAAALLLFAGSLFSFFL